MHLRGGGCGICSREQAGRKRRLTNEDFIKSAIKKHGELYDYTETFYEYSDIDVIILCRFHGQFNQNPSNHLQGAGCPKCSDKAKGLLTIRKEKNTYRRF